MTDAHDGLGTATIEPRQVANTISREMVRLYSRRLGRGPTKARTTANTNMVMVVFQDTLTKSERTLIGAGKEDAVTSTRLSIAAAMRDEAVEIVEGLTRRTVTAYAPGLDPAADVSVVAFLLDPIPESGLVEVVEHVEDGAGG